MLNTLMTFNAGSKPTAAHSLRVYAIWLVRHLVVSSPLQLAIVKLHTHQGGHMHYYSLSLGPDMVRLYRGLRSNQVYNYPGFADMSSYEGDSLFLNGQNPYGLTQAVISQPLACQNVLGRPKTAYSSIPVDVRTERPVKLDWTWQADVSRYGSMLMLNSELSQQAPTEHFREHGVSHPNFVGSLTDLRSDWSYAYSLAGDDRSWFGATSPRYSLTTGLAGPLSELYHLGYSPSGYPTYYTWYSQVGPSGSYGLDCDAFDLSKNILSLGKSSGSLSTIYQDGDRAVYTDFDGDVIRDGNHFQWNVSYTFSKERYSLGTLREESKFRVNIRFFLEFREVWGPLDDVSWNPIHPDVVQFKDLSSVQPLGYTVDGISTPQSVGDGIRVELLSRTQLFTQPLRQSVGTEPFFYAYRRQGTPHLYWLHGLMKVRTEAQMRFLRPSSFMSSADALDKQMNAFSGNLLQNLQHIKDIASLFPNPADFERLIAKAIKGDPSAIKDCLDLITQLILKYRFEIAPLLRDVEKLRKLDISLVEQASKVQTLTSYGQFKYVFLDSENWMHDGKLELVTRSKIRFISDPSTLMGQLLMANSVGLLPTLARIWNLLPFSFVVDWFTNMSKRLHLVDDQVLWLALRVVFATHSYKVTYYPSNEALAAYNLQHSSLGDQFGVSMYIREFTRITPRLTESPYDFLRPTSGPDPLTVGSLMWQFI